MSRTPAERAVHLVMRRLISARKGRGLTHTDAATASGLGLPSQRKLEGQWNRGVPHLRLDQVILLAQAYRVDLRDLLDGWGGDARNRPPPVRPEPMNFPSVEETCERVAMNLHACRVRKGVGYRIAAGSALGNPGLGPSLFRLETGQATHESFTMLKLVQLAVYYEVSVAELVLGDLTATPTEPPP